MGRLYGIFCLLYKVFSLRPLHLCGGLNSYQQCGRIITNEYLVKWFIFQDAITKNRTDGAMVRLITEIKPDEDFSGADRRLSDFVRTLNPYLAAHIPN
ncbi:MAG: exosortase-associated EpsI family protein [Candidatus Brocadia sp.]|nr:exosortase-associated EpsI family protein [Candidatus Brocadia sp.]